VSEAQLEKHYTVDEANRTLPYVRRIVQDIVSNYATWQTAMRDIELLSAGPRGDDTVSTLARMQKEAQRLAADIDSCIADLDALEISFKGYDLGLVDFPTEMDGQPAYLCWKLGEPAVAHWHDIESGFAGRRPLDPHFVG
jgi:hypothetical protein